MQKPDVAHHVRSTAASLRRHSEADQAYFDELLPLEDLDFSTADELELTPSVAGVAPINQVNVRSQTGVLIEEIPLIEDDEEALAALKLLRDKGYSKTELVAAFEELQPVPVTRVRERQAKRLELDARVKTEVGKILAERRLNAEGKDLDRLHLNRSNYVNITAALQRSVNLAVGRKSGERAEFTRDNLDAIETDWSSIVAAAKEDLFNGKP